MKTVLITGSSRGIGAEIAKYFVNNKYNVVINYLNSEKEAIVLKKQLETNHVKVLTIKADVASEEQVKKMYDECLAEFGFIDVVVNNAAIAIDTLVEDKKVEDFKSILNVNLIGTFLVCKYFGQKMFNEKKGSIINISSTNGIDTYYPYGMDYDASKAGVISLSNNFATLYAPFVRVNTVAPGWVETDMNSCLDANYKIEECSKILLGRFASPEEIASVVYFIANASYINSSVIRVDGGKKC